MHYTGVAERQAPFLMGAFYGSTGARRAKWLKKIAKTGVWQGRKRCLFILEKWCNLRPCPVRLAIFSPIRADAVVAQW